MSAASTRRTIAVALFNDTGDNPHVGCLAVSQAHRLMLRRAGAVVRHAFFHRDWQQLWHDDLEQGIRTALGCDELRHVFSEVDVVVVNGEGTIHHRQGRHLLAILGAAQRLGLATVLVNAVLQDIDDSREVLAALSDLTVRDAKSARYLASGGVPHRLVPDSFFEARFVDVPAHDFRGHLVITDCHPDRTAEFAAALDALRRDWRGPVSVYPLEGPERIGDWGHAVADLRAADVVVTGRHHGACLALRAGVPFVTLPSNTWKIEGLLDLCDGYPEATADASRPLIDRVAAALTAREWFVEASRRWAARLPLATFDRVAELATPAAFSTPPKRVSPRTRDAIRAVYRPGGKLVHVGCGRGDLLTSLLSEGHDVVGVDVSAAVRDRARVPTRIQTGTAEQLPFGDRAFATVVVAASWIEHLDPDALERALSEIVRIADDAVVIESTARPWRTDEASFTVRGRAWWEHRLMSAGLRRHTRLTAAVGFESLDVLHGDTVLVMQRSAVTLPTRAAGNGDALRAIGPAADVALAAYEWARQIIKPGDVVVDCEGGSGTAVLWDGSEAARVVGLARDPHTVDAMSAEYGRARSGLEFRVAVAGDWSAWADHSVDCIVWLAGGVDAARCARESTQIERVLRPGGRFLLTTTESLDQTHTAMPQTLLIDDVQALSSGGTSAAPTRAIRRVDWQPGDACPIAPDLWLVSAIKDPIAFANIAYTERVFPSDASATPNAIAFGRDYKNPWAVHALVMGQFRVKSPRLLQKLARRWLDESPADSPDAGAALCVLAYRALDGSNEESSQRLLDLIATYCALAPASPHLYRWQVSLRFVAGQLLLRRGDLVAAEHSFRACALDNASAFTPHLETKTTEAAWMSGRLALERGDRDRARADWELAGAALERMKSATVADWLITPTRPAAFEFGDGLREIAMTVDSAARSASALRHLHEFGNGWRPGPRAIDRNFQTTTARLLEVVGQRGGEIVALREALGVAEQRQRALAEDLHGTQQGWRADAEHWRAEIEAGRSAIDATSDARRQLEEELARVSRERALLAKRLRKIMKRVVIVGAGDEGRRLWEALAGRGVEVVGFVDADERRHDRDFLGTTVHPPAWLADASWDQAIIACREPHRVLDDMRGSGISWSRIAFAPVDQDDEALTAWAGERFPDALAGMTTGASAAGLKVGIFGTGAGGLRVWEALAELDTCDAAWFADNNPTQQGRTLLWLDIIAPSRIPSLRYDAIVIGSISREPIERQLLALGVPADQILAPNLVHSTEHVRIQLDEMLAGLAVEVTR